MLAHVHGSRHQFRHPDKPGRAFHIRARRSRTARSAASTGRQDGTGRGR
ncbi:hypothetical protein [Geminicoccus flavidas]|nr:hypothetical protein [Geminicoccus flavidas]